MKVEVELSEETAACIWQDHHRAPLSEILADLAETNAADFRRAFPGRAVKTVADFREAHPEGQSGQKVH